MSQRVQLNLSVNEETAKKIRDQAKREGRKLGDLIDKLAGVYEGNPLIILERLRRVEKKDLTPQDRTALQEASEYISWLLYSKDD